MKLVSLRILYTSTLILQVKDTLLAMRAGDPVSVYSTENDDEGWWLGGVDTKVGYFPKIFVDKALDFELQQTDTGSQ